MSVIEDIYSKLNAEHEREEYEKIIFGSKRNNTENAQ